MPVIPLSVVTAAFALATEALRTFNGLPDDVRTRIVTDMLDDKDARDRAWEKFTGWVGGLFAKVDPKK